MKIIIIFNEYFIQNFTYSKKNLYLVLVYIYIYIKWYFNPNKRKIIKIIF